MLFNEAIQLQVGQNIMIIETQKQATVVKVDEAIPEDCPISENGVVNTALVFCNNGRVYTQNQITFPQ